MSDFPMARKLALTVFVDGKHKHDGVEAFNRRGAEANPHVWGRQPAPWIWREMLGKGLDGKANG